MPYLHYGFAIEVAFWLAHSSDGHMPQAEQGEVTVQSQAHFIYCLGIIPLLETLNVTPERGLATLTTCCLAQLAPCSLLWVLLGRISTGIVRTLSGT